MALLNSACWHPTLKQNSSPFISIASPSGILYSSRWHPSFQLPRTNAFSPNPHHHSVSTLSIPRFWHLALYLLFWTSWHKNAAQLSSACHQIATMLGIYILRGSGKWHHNCPKFHITPVKSIPVKKHWKWLSILTSWNWCWWGWFAASWDDQNFRNPQPRPEVC